MATFSIPTYQSPPINPDTGLFRRDWFIFLNNLINATGQGQIGTTTQVLHGGGSGFSAIDLTNDVTNILPGVNGGTGVNNALKTITLGGSLTIGGTDPITLNTTGPTNVTIPTSGTLLVSANIGTIATQDASNVIITGGSLSGVAITNATLTGVTVNAVRLVTIGSFSLVNHGKIESNVKMLRQ